MSLQKNFGNLAKQCMKANRGVLGRYRFLMKLISAACL